MEVIAHARREAPVEACGILAGNDSTVEKYYPMRNTDNSSEHFLMDPGEQFEIMKEMRNSDQHMLAIFHSHPYTPARPSEEDIRMALTPDVVYLITSLNDADNPVTKGFFIKDDAVTPVQLRIEDERQ
jgi:proteasome lid subunit RPN8/RPN11